MRLARLHRRAQNGASLAVGALLLLLAADAVALSMGETSSRVAAPDASGVLLALVLLYLSMTLLAPRWLPGARVAGRQALGTLRALPELPAARREQRALRGVLASVGHGIITTDRAGRITTFNPAAERITGVAGAEAIGRHCSELFKRRMPACQTECDSARCPIRLAGGAARPTCDCRPNAVDELVVLRSGARVPLVRTVSPILDEGRGAEVTGTVWLIREPSREEREAHLASEMVALVSHQLRAPLATISGSAQLLATSAVDEATRAELLATLDRQAQRMNRLATEMLHSSRMDSGRFAPQLEPVALAPLVAQAVALQRASHPSHRFALAAPPGPCIALADAVACDVIVDNLVQNAVKYSPEGSAITITIEAAGEGWRLAVADEGPGVPAEQIPTLFDRFTRFPSADGRRRPGFGLGLYLVKQLAEAQGGAVGAESQPGRGARFWITLRGLESFYGEDSDR